MKSYVAIIFLLITLLLHSLSALAEQTTLPGVRNVAPLAAIETDAEVVVLDVRTIGEYESGHIPDAVNIDVTQESFKEEIQKLDPSLTYLVHCGANAPNGRADRALASLQEAGFENLENLEGGYVAWVDAGGPVSKP